MYVVRLKVEKYRVKIRDRGVKFDCWYIRNILGFFLGSVR